MKNICVFCGSRKGTDPIFSEKATEVGQYLAQNDYRLVYGAGNVGLMGVITDAVLANGGEAIGIIPEFLEKWEVAHDNLTELIITQTMHERKAIMAERSDAVIALPGGYGTLDELFEILTWRQLKLHEKPIGLLNVKGYFNPLIQMIDQMQAEGFLSEENRQFLLVSDDINDLFAQFHAFRAIVEEKWIDKSKI